MIYLKNIRRDYADFSLRIDFSVAAGEIVSLLGSSGSGKTTTLRIIAGFEDMDSGEIRIDDQDISRKRPQDRNLGFVFQDYTLFPHLTVADNIAYGLRANRVPRERRSERVDELLDLVGLQGFDGRSVQHLSGGEQQRVALARALAPQPRALLLDEPFSAVDTERREDLRRQVIRIQRSLQIPMVFVTHSQSEALSISDRIVLLRGGRVVEQGTPEELYLRPRTAYAAGFLGRANLLPGDALRFREDGGSGTETAAAQAAPEPAAPATPAAEDGGALVSGSPASSGTAAPAKTSTSAVYLVRPEQVCILGYASDCTSDGDFSGNAASKPDNALPAQVREAHYRGMFWEYDLDSHLGSIGAVSRYRYQAGDRVQLQFEAAHPIEQHAQTAQSEPAPAKAAHPIGQLDRM